MNRLLLSTLALACCGAAVAKLPPPDEAAKAKAAEAAAKTAWQGKVDAYQLCRAQDKVVSWYKGHAPARKAASAGVAPVSASATSAAPAATAGAAESAPVAAAAASAAKAAASTGKPVTPSATASQGGSTPVAAVTNPAPAIPPCADPGPFAYAPPDQKPLETSGAHSPAATAASPPSVRTPSAEMKPTKPGVATKP